jgi:hypothetical protein
MSDIVSAELPATHRIPAALAREIGRVIISFAKLEWMINRLVYFVLTIDDNLGRLIVKDQDGAEQFKLLCRLLRMKGIETRTELDPIAAAIRSCQSQRNDIAHSIWVISPITNKPMICLFRGEWSKDDDVEVKSRKFNPEGRAYPIEEAISLINLIDGAITSLETLYNELCDIRHTSLQKPQLPSPLA